MRRRSASASASLTARRAWRSCALEVLDDRAGLARRLLDLLERVRAARRARRPPPRRPPPLPRPRRWRARRPLRAASRRRTCPARPSDARRTAAFARAGGLRAAEEAFGPCALAPPERRPSWPELGAAAVFFGAGLRRHQRHRVHPRLGLALEPPGLEELAHVVVDRRGVQRRADLVLGGRRGVLAQRQPRELADRLALARGRVAHRRGVARAVEQRGVRRAQLLAGRQQVVGAVLAHGQVDRAGRDARALQALDEVGVLAALLAAQALRQRVAGGGELVEREPVEIVGLVEHGSET